METSNSHHHEPWNKGKLIGQKAPLKLKEIWAIRVRLELSQRTRDLALFNLAIDSKLRACDLVKLKVRDISHGDRVTSRAMSCRRRLEDPFNLRLPNRRVNQFLSGLKHLT
jgi:hypothetical protein